jgi:alpha-D-ribose 1-methylphosphonate 5-phosphate C-P lyase
MNGDDRAEPARGRFPRLGRLADVDAGYNFGFLDEVSKKEIRRGLLKAVAIPGYQVPFGSREMPIGRGWGTGGLQITLALLGPADIVKVIDQGSDAGVNAVNIRRLIERTAPGVRTTPETGTATIVQSRHRVPEQRLRPDQLLVLQVPEPEPLRNIEPRETVTRLLHAEAEYARIWVHLYEDIVTNGEISRASGYPVLVNGRYIMAPSPIPRWDLHKLHQANHLTLLGAGREKRLYAVPPLTDVVPLDFEDHPFRVEDFKGEVCARCGSSGTYLDEIPVGEGERRFFCSDSAACDAQLDVGAPRGRPR